MKPHPLQASAFSAGLEHLFQIRMKMSQEFTLRMAAEDKICRKLGDNEEALEANERKRREIAEAHWLLTDPVWQQMSGLYNGCQNFLSPNERALRVRQFMTNVQRLIRFELKEISRKDAETQRKDTEEPTWIRPSVEWSPVPAICTYLEISHRKLSSLCKEMTGFGIEQLIDCIKAETLRSTLKERLKGFLLGWFKDKKDVEANAKEIYADLKSSRREDSFNRITWAMELGFGSYQKLFRASELTERLSPHELEIVLIEELLQSTQCVPGQNQDANGNGSRKDAETQRKDSKNGGKEDETLIKEAMRTETVPIVV